MGVEIKPRLLEFNSELKKTYVPTNAIFVVFV